MTQKHENDTSCLVREAAYIIHVTLGPSPLELGYETLLCYELRKFRAGCADSGTPTDSV